jgi:putative transcriptional regulator
MEQLKGRLLIAGGGLLDLNFRQTVVLVAEHNEDGAVGVVLNRPATLTLTEAAPELTSLPGVDERIFLGGPVAPENAVILADFERPDMADSLVFGSIGLHGADPESAPVVDPIVTRARVFAGYAGWGPGQLEAEIASDAWITEPALPDDVFCTDPDDLWRRVLKRKGPRYEMLALMPFDPSTN